ncbi:MAG: DUF2384 domain-containing protein [Acidobacteria bacterium]|nr:DUF2384 domain-containing protein [Acidobacteriota bacterium]
MASFAQETHSEVLADVRRFREAKLSAAPGKHAYVALLGLRSFDTRHLIRRVQQGLSFASFERLRRNMELSTADLAELVQISPRTLSRRKKARRLQPDESDRLLRLSRVFAEAIDLFEGDADAARSWLARPQPAFDGETPLNLMTTDVGTREVEALIGRLEHGVFS